MEPLAFDNGIIINHKFYRHCGKTLDTVSKKDYPDEEFFDKSILCLDMDAFETQTHKGSKEHTVDAIIGIKDFSNNKFHSHRLLLIELRIDFESEKRLSKTELEKKVCHTKELLGNDIAINKISFFVFKQDIINRVINWFNNKSQEGGNLKFCKPISTKEFGTLIKSENSFPYVPITDLKSLEKTLLSFLEQKDYSKFINQTEYWLKEAARFKRQYNNEEHRLIMEVITGLWRKFRTSSPILSDDESIDTEILEEDYEALTKITNMLDNRNKPQSRH
ncbi:hypothetical protein [Xylanibacter muris]|uniref:Uncharacterized protein n=1 Tax=Xylanibacter muris TaxID=2736290 RepID=A0ABX2AKR5_9BACT|nr:hypothetical protein [Xylanibacter muris]NPD91644.1 hypothetical protein [Xylanibacter muris]